MADGSHIINIDDSNFIFKTREDILYGEDNNIGMPLIQKIEKGISYEDTKACQPNILSIGPYHHEKLSTKDMQVMKYECLQYILKLNEHAKLEDYMEAIKDIEFDIRKCYGDEIEMDRNSFLKMLLLDGCFLIHSLHGIEGISPPMQDISTQHKGIEMKTDEQNGQCIIDMDTLEVDEKQQNIGTDQQDEVNKDDSYHIRMWYSNWFSSDILLVENQIPFFVLTKIYEISMGTSNKTPLLSESIAKFVEGMMDSYPISIKPFNRPKNFHNLLHLCHLYFKPSKKKIEIYESLDCELGDWHRATEYHKAGIKIRKKDFCKDNPHTLLDISFSDGTMEIPCLTIDHNTRCLFHNLIAFERTCPQFGNWVTAYIILWSQLISKPNDVALLTNRGIIVHQLNSDAEVSDLFAKLREGIVLDLVGDCYLKSTYCEIEAYYQRNKPRLMTGLDKVVSKFSTALSIVTQKYPLNHL